MMVVNETGTFNYTYVYANGVLAARINPDGSKWFYHADHLGSTTLITSETSDIVEETFYMPYGGLLDGGTKEIKLYEGMELDETGTYYYNSRYYSPSMRMFTQPDSIIPDIYDPQQLNIYAFERGNPLAYTDESGNVIEDVPFIAMGVLDIIEDPKDWMNYASLGIDIALLAAPGIGGLGKIGKEIIKSTGDVGKVAKVANKAGDVGKSTGRINEPGKFTRELSGDTIREYGKFNPATKPGPTAGRRAVKEIDTKTNKKRVWMELYDKYGRVTGVHPKTPKDLGHFKIDPVIRRVIGWRP